MFRPVTTSNSASLRRKTTPLSKEVGPRPALLRDRRQMEPLPAPYCASDAELFDERCYDNAAPEQEIRDSEDESPSRNLYLVLSRARQLRRRSRRSTTPILQHSSSGERSSSRSVSPRRRKTVRIISPRQTRTQDDSESKRECARPPVRGPIRAVAGAPKFDGKS